MVADIGGTNARFALADVSQRGIALTQMARLQTSAFSDIQGAVEAYLSGVGARVTQACFAVAAPIEGDEVHFTNNPWSFLPETLKAALALDRFAVINDFEALAAGIAHLPPAALQTLHAGVRDPDAPQLVIGPGTGLGQALIVPCSGRAHTVPTQGGHVSFAPRSPLEMQILAHLHEETGDRVSAEHVLSGQGLVTLYGALSVICGVSATPLKPYEIMARGLSGDSSLAVQTLEVFCSILGAVVGDAVLSAGARGGVFIGGGIAPRMAGFLKASAFTQSMHDKGPMRAFVSRVPAYLITGDDGALYGAAVIGSDKNTP